MSEPLTTSLIQSCAMTQSSFPRFVRPAQSVPRPRVVHMHVKRHETIHGARRHMAWGMHAMARRFTSQLDRVEGGLKAYKSPSRGEDHGVAARDVVLALVARGVRRLSIGGTLQIEVELSIQPLAGAQVGQSSRRSTFTLPSVGEPRVDALREEDAGRAADDDEPD